MGNPKPVLIAAAVLGTLVLLAVLVLRINQLTRENLELQGEKTQTQAASVGATTGEYRKPDKIEGVDAAPSVSARGVATWGPVAKKVPPTPGAHGSVAPESTLPTGASGASPATHTGESQRQGSAASCDLDSLTVSCEPEFLLWTTAKVPTARFNVQGYVASPDGRERILPAKLVEVPAEGKPDLKVAPELNPISKIPLTLQGQLGVEAGFRPSLYAEGALIGRHWGGYLGARQDGDGHKYLGAGAVFQFQFSR